MVRLFTFIAIGAFFMAYLGQNAAVSRHLANVVGPVDGRKPLYLNGAELFLSANEVAHLRSAVGYVNCGNPNAWVTGFLIASDVVVTVAHIFRTVEGAAVGPYENCFFETQGDKSGVRYFFRRGGVALGHNDPHKERSRDFAVGRLQKIVEGGRALPIRQSPIQIHDWEGLLPVSAYRGQKYVKPGDFGSEPLGQLCNARKFFPGDGVLASTFYSDCDNTEGGSGSPVLQRLKDNVLTVIGIFEAGGKAPDGAPYSEGPESKSLAFALSIDGPFLTTIRSFQVAE